MKNYIWIIKDSSGLRLIEFEAENKYFSHLRLAAFLFENNLDHRGAEFLIQVSNKLLPAQITQISDLVFEI